MADRGERKFYATRLWMRTFRRRSQKDRFTWERMKKLAADWLPKPKILHPWPNVRFSPGGRHGDRMDLMDLMDLMDKVDGAAVFCVHAVHCVHQVHQVH